MAPTRRRILRLKMLALLMCLGVVVALQLGVTSPESPDIDEQKTAKVKAAYLYNFIKFVKWPEPKFSDPKAPYVICIWGKDPFGSLLDRTVNGKTVSGRPIVIRRVISKSSDTLVRSDCEDCHVLFVSTSERQREEEIHALAMQLNILTVSDRYHFAPEGGMIGLLLKKGKIIFEVNYDVIKKADLKMSSKLLKLARIVTTQKRRIPNAAPRESGPTRLDREAKGN